MPDLVRLGVNVDHVASLRQARKGNEPDPVTAAALAEMAGADGISVHLRGDRRHIQERDLQMLREIVRTRLNLVMAANPAMVTVAATHKPEQVTLVPERQEEMTTESGLDVLLNQTLVRKTAIDLREAGITASIFEDASLELDKIVQAARAGSKLGLRVLAGHGLDYRNVRPIARLPEIVELNIGHAIVARATLVGMDRAVREMKELLRR
jgi:pyridoxine 5-phosphate synthase